MSLNLTANKLLTAGAIIALLLLSGCHSSSSATKSTESTLAEKVITDGDVDTTGLSATEIQITNLSEVDATGLTYSISDSDGQSDSPRLDDGSQFFALYNGSNAYKNWCRGSSCDDSCSNLANNTLKPSESCTLYVRAMKAGAVNSIHQAQLTITGDDLDHTQTLTLSNQLALVAGGDFTAAHDGSSTQMNHIAAYYDGRWQALGQGHGGGFNDIVYALAVDGSGNLLAGGAFTENYEGNTKLNRIAEYHNGQWQAIGQIQNDGGGFNNGVQTILVDDEGNLFAGGHFTAAENGTELNYIGEYSNGQWQAVGQGSGGGFTLPQAPEDATVDSLLKDSAGDLIAAGQFTYAGDGTPMNNIAQYDNNNGQWQQMGADYEYNDDGETITVPGGGFYSSTSGNTTGLWVDALGLDSSGKLIVSGYKMVFAGVKLKVFQIAQYESDSGLWERLYNNDNNGFNSSQEFAHSITTDSAGNLFMAGAFDRDQSGGELRSITELVGDSLKPLGVNQDSGVDNTVYALTADNAGNLFLAGRFSCSVPVDPAAHRATVTTQQPKEVQDIPAACISPPGQAVGDGGNYTLMSFVGEYSSDKTWHPLGQGEDGAGLNNWTYALTTVPLLSITKD